MRECPFPDGLAVTLNTTFPGILHIGETTNKFRLVTRPNPQQIVDNQNLKKHE